MFCGKCGSEIPNGCEFCMKCGTKVELKNIKTVKQEVIKKKRLKIIIPVFVGLLLAIVIGIYFIFFHSTSCVEGRYYNLYTGNGYREFTINKNDTHDGTYIEKITNDDANSFDGDYKIEDGKVIIEDSLLKSQTAYVIYKNYLVATDYLYEGEIPQGEKFDAICKYDDSKFVFNRDGTMLRDDKKGTYKRSGDIISFKLEENTQLEYKLLIYDNRVVNSVYYKK